MYLVNEPVMPTLTIGMIEPNHLHPSNYRMDPPTLPFDWDGQTSASDPVDVGGGRVEYTLSPEYTATDATDSALDLDFGFDMTIPNPDLLDLPDDIEQTIGSIEVDIETRPLQIRIQWCPLLPCFDGVIETGLTTTEGMSVNYLDESDIDPDSIRTQWLYVSGDGGMEYYRINRDSKGDIRSTFLRGDLGPGGAFRGVVPVSYRDGGTIARGLFVYGDGGGWRSNWFDDPVNPSNSGYGIQLGIAFSNVPDAVAYGGLDQTYGYCFARLGVINFIEYYQPAGMFAGNGSLAGGEAFEGADGNPILAFVNPLTNGVLAIMDGPSSQVWFHDRVDPFEPGNLVTTVGNDPKQIRGYGSVIAVTNFGSNSVSVLTWNGGSSATNHGQVPVGTGPIGIDAMPLLNGNVGFICTSATDNTYNYIEVSTNGSIVQNIVTPLPQFCGGARYAVFLPGSKVYIVFSCAGGDLEFVETTLEY
jgi:hypothetical protein